MPLQCRPSGPCFCQSESPAHVSSDTMQPVHVFGFPAKDRPYLNISGRGSGLALSGGGGATRSAVFCSGHATPARSARSAKPYAFMAWSLAIIAVVAGGAASIPESALYGSNHINPTFHDAPCLFAGDATHHGPRFERYKPAVLFKDS